MLDDDEDEADGNKAATATRKGRDVFELDASSTSEDETQDDANIEVYDGRTDADSTYICFHLLELFQRYSK